MEKSFFKDEYRIIKADSTEFSTYEAREKVDAVPFVFVKKEDGSVKYAAAGVHDGTELRRIERSEPAKVFNLSRARAALT